MEHKTRTKAMSWLLSLVLTLGLLPAFSSPALATEGDSTYTLTIPSTLNVSGSGWNATSGISATGTLADGKTLAVTATSANNWALKSGDNSVGYTLTTAEGGSRTTSWEFTTLDGTAKPMGIIVEDYSSMPAGTYTDTVTFTAAVESLLTTITPTAKEQASYSTEDVATVSFSYTAEGSSAYTAIWGWWGYGWSATVTPAEGYTITKCVFYDDQNRTATDSEAPFVVETTEGDKTPQVNGTPILAYTSKGITKIEVYGYATS